MTTQYDLHETLLHIAHEGYSKERDFSHPNSTQRAFSLLRKVYPERSCFEAHVPEDYCPCYKEFPIPPSEAQKPAEILLEFANKLIYDYDNVNDVLEHVENVIPVEKEKENLHVDLVRSQVGFLVLIQI